MPPKTFYTQTCWASGQVWSLPSTCPQSWHRDACQSEHSRDREGSGPDRWGAPVGRVRGKSQPETVCGVLTIGQRLGG